MKTTKVTSEDTLTDNHALPPEKDIKTLAIITQSGAIQFFAVKYTEGNAYGHSFGVPPLTDSLTTHLHENSFLIDNQLLAKTVRGSDFCFPLLADIILDERTTA
jgi:hypothetical protein